MRSGRRWAGAFLATWALGLVVATVQLHAWQEALSRVLVQVQADALLRARSARAGDAVQPGWYRQRALALLSAVERLHDDTAWSLVMPGSWRMFDNLEERVRAHIARAFSVTVVETLRRELEASGGRLTGLAVEPQTATLDITGPCRAPQAAADGAASARTLDVHQMPEHAGLVLFLDAAARLDRAATALLALLEQAPARPQDLRIVVRYSLGADLSHPASRSLALFRAVPEANDPKGQAWVDRLRTALACTASRGLEALHDRMVRRNDLLELEAAVARVLDKGLFEPPPAGLEPAGLARLRTMVALIEAQQALLASGDHAWMHSAGQAAGQGLGEVHERLLAQVRQISLLGPAIASSWEARARADAMQLAQSLRRLMGGTDARLAWDAQAGQFMLTAHRRALLAGLTALLDQPFMTATTIAPLAPASMAADPEVLEDLAALGRQRRRFVGEVLPIFPPELRAEVSRFAHHRIARVAAARARPFVFPPVDAQAATTGTTEGPGERLAMIDNFLREAGEAQLARWLVRTLGEEIPRCDLMRTACPAPAIASPPRAWGNAVERATPASGGD